MKPETLAVLQAVADATVGCVFASADFIHENLANHHDDITQDRMLAILARLEGKYLVEGKTIKDRPYYRLTSDGKRVRGLIIDLD